MMLARFARWLHTGWPAGTVEKLPEVGEDGRTAVPGLYVVGDLAGVPLLKIAADSGARAVRAIVADGAFQRGPAGDPIADLVIVGGGVSGIAAALEARKAGLQTRLFEASEPWSTIANFPRKKPIFTYPTGMQPAGELRVTADVKEALLEELEAQRLAAGIAFEKARVERVERVAGTFVVQLAGQEPVRARRVIVAIGRSGNYRRLGVPGETLDKVTHRLYDPNDHAGQRCLVVGGGDSALETAIALAMAGAEVTLSYRGRELARAKPENLDKLQALVKDPRADVAIEHPSSERVTASFTVAQRKAAQPGSVHLVLGSQLREIRADEVLLTDADGRELRLGNDVVFAMIGREAPLDFFRRSGVPIRGEWRAPSVAALVAFLAACVFVYTWKSGGAVTTFFKEHGLFPFNLPEHLGAGALGATLAVTLREPGFYYSTAYTVAIVLFGIARIRRRQTPYVTRQTLTLMAIQIIPLFLLPYIVFPLVGHAGLFDHGAGKAFADAFFPEAGYGHGREYWRSFGFILAWPLFIWNFFSGKPMTAWLVVGLVQTFVLIPLMVRRWGKGAYCGWICSCGALAETMGDQHRQKMPHGPAWNRLNFAGQGILAIAFLLFGARVLSWVAPGSLVGHWSQTLYDTLLSNNAVFGVSLDYYHVVDITLAGIVGVGLYFWFSGRVWCRFFCPLAALMHLYARASKFRIFAEKKKCISCNVCTSVCHQGIDVMSFANKGLPMEDPECVRCSACVQSCPTGTLSFGRLGRDGAPVLDTLAASPVQMREGKVTLRVVT